MLYEIFLCAVGRHGIWKVNTALYTSIAMGKKQQLLAVDYLAYFEGSA